MLWSITGFSSSNPTPAPLSAPTTHDSARDTRSTFISANTSPNTPQYVRLLQFAVPDSDIMFMRFGFYPGSATTNPVLAMCNTASKVFFWDLARLEEYYDYLASINAAAQPESINPAISTEVAAGASAPDVKRPSFLIPYRHRNRSSLNVLSRLARDASPSESTSTDTNSNPNSFSHRHAHPHSHTAPGMPADPPSRSQPAPLHQQSVIAGLTPSDVEKSLEIWGKRYAISDPNVNIFAHKDEVVKGLGFVGRQIAWSRGGEWCVVVGSAGVIGVFERWQK